MWISYFFSQKINEQFIVQKRKFCPFFFVAGRFKKANDMLRKFVATFTFFQGSKTLAGILFANKFSLLSNKTRNDDYADDLVGVDEENHWKWNHVCFFVKQICAKSSTRASSG
jgi:hypothetical protein